MTGGSGGSGGTGETGDASSAPDGLLAYLRDAFGDASLDITRYERLSGGAIQQNIALELTRDGGARTESLVLRTDAPSGVAVSRSRAEEHALLGAAFDAGVTVPEPLQLCTDTAVIGAPFFLMRRVGGTAHPIRLTRGDLVDGARREALVAALGAELARVHAVPLDDARLAFLHDEAPANGAAGGTLAARVVRYRGLLDALGARRPVMERALDWLATRRVADHGPVLCHNDFRTGNLMIEPEAARVAGVLDWEFAGTGDPHEDIGWFCAPCWRFAAREREGGGIGSREAFYAGYERASGRTIDREAVAIWEIVATLRWAVIALQQGERFLSGQEESLELALTGRMVVQMERDLLELMAAVDPGLEEERAGDDADGDLPDAERAGAGLPFEDDAPDGAALLRVARRTLLDTLLPALPEARRYEGLMVANAMRIAAREVARSSSAMSGGSVAGLHEGEPPVRADDVSFRQLRRDVERRLALVDPKRAGGES